MVTISLGWNCNSAIRAKELGLRASKVGGYNTCPFDIMNSNYEGIIKCLDDDFKYFLDTDYLTLLDMTESDKYNKDSIYI